MLSGCGGKCKQVHHGNLPTCRPADWRRWSSEPLNRRTYKGNDPYLVPSQQQIHILHVNICQLHGSCQIGIYNCNKRGISSKSRLAADK